MSADERILDGLTPITSYEFSKKSFLTELCLPAIVYGAIALVATGVYVGFNWKDVNVPRVFGEVTCILCCAFFVSVLCQTKPINISWVLAFVLIACNGSILIGHHYKDSPTVKKVRGMIAGFTDDEIDEQVNKQTPSNTTSTEEDPLAGLINITEPKEQLTEEQSTEETSEQI